MPHAVVCLRAQPRVQKCFIFVCSFLQVRYLFHRHNVKKTVQLLGPWQRSVYLGLMWKSLSNSFAKARLAFRSKMFARFSRDSRENIRSKTHFLRVSQTEIRWVLPIVKFAAQFGAKLRLIYREVLMIILTSCFFSSTCGICIISWSVFAYKIDLTGVCQNILGRKIHV
jgi:hypothetical protein